MAAAALVVDDDPALISSLRTALAPHPVRLEIAHDVATATAYLDSNTYCGLVLDLVLDGGSGFDVLRHLEAKGIALPTVVITAKLPSYIREMLDEQHVKLVLPKPVDPRLLATLVLGLCGIPT